jgi:hypothetical protein
MVIKSMIVVVQGQTMDIKQRYITALQRQRLLFSRIANEYQLALSICTGYCPVSEHATSQYKYMVPLYKLMK